MSNDNPSYEAWVERENQLVDRIRELEARLGVPDFLVYVNANNDANGNPRRGWIHYRIVGSYEHAGIVKHDMAPMAFYDEGYSGYGAIPREYQGAPVTGTIQVTPAEYRAWERFKSKL